MSKDYELEKTEKNGTEKVVVKMVEKQPKNTKKIAEKEL